VSYAQLGNGSYWSYQYDTRGRVTNLLLEYDAPTWNTTDNTWYVYDGVSNVKNYTHTSFDNTNSFDTYTYDWSNRLTNEVRTNTVQGKGPTYTNVYNYDNNGNRTSVTRNGVTSTYSVNSSDDELLSGDGYAFSGYDGDGNPSSYTNAGVTMTLSYDEENRPALLSSSKNGVQMTNFYDATGKRVGYGYSAGNIYCVFDGSDIIEYASSTSGAVEYELPGVVETNATGSPFWIYSHPNAMGSTLRFDTSDPTTAASRFEYDAFGQQYIIQAGSKNQFLFGGQHGYQSDFTGQVLCGARYYLPTVGRFLTQDPSGQSAGLNLYEYCGNNPVSKSDPTGLEEVRLTKDSKYYPMMSNSIGRINSTPGYEAFASGLSAMIDAGSVFIETDPSKMATTYADGTRGDAEAFVSMKDGRMVVGPVFWSDEAKAKDVNDKMYCQYHLQSALVHEYQHENQYTSGNYHNMSRREMEIDACHFGEKYAKWHMDREPNRALNLEWFNCWNQQVTYRRQMGG